jgi:hypothetical protein
MVLRSEIVASAAPEGAGLSAGFSVVATRPGLHFETRRGSRLSTCNPEGRQRGKHQRKPGPVAGTSDAECEGIAMKDLLFILVTSTFFVVAWLYARACDEV